MATEERTRDNRPHPPKAGRDRICDICGRAEDACRLIPEGTSGHTFEPKPLLHTGPDYRARTQLAPAPDRKLT